MTDPNDDFIGGEELPPTAGQFVERAILQGHNQSITALQVNPEHQILVSGSRDRTALVWKLARSQDLWGIPYTRLVGHNHFVSGVSLAADSTHLLTSSWDKTIRLWTLDTRTTKTKFVDHQKDVLAVTFSPDNRRIVSCGRDKVVKLWNILGECKVNLAAGESWATSISCASDQSDPSNPLIVAAGYWDGKVKISKIGEHAEDLFTLSAHNGRVSSVAFTPDGKWLLTGGSDRKVLLWSVTDGVEQRRFSATAPVNAIAPCPTRAWVCAATYEGIAVWDIEKSDQIDLVQPEFKTPPGTKADREKGPRGRHADCTALAWADDGSVLYAGYSNGDIRVWEVRANV
jgi:guanine nucleotide-binding protein subunit beta-2-like 1 protein